MKNCKPETRGKSRKQAVKTLFYLVLSQLIFNYDVSAQTKLGDNVQQLRGTAILELESDSMGLLIPRLDSSEAGKLAPLAKSTSSHGLLIFNTHNNRFEQFDTTGMGFWRPLFIPDPAWETDGNTGGDESFVLGHHDSISLRIITDSVEYLRLTPRGVLEMHNTGKSVFLGEYAGAQDDHSNNANVFIGYGSGGSSITGLNNVAIGSESLAKDKIGLGNVAIGVNALKNDTFSQYNTAVGVDALKANLGGTRNTAVGAHCLLLNTVGSHNAAMGHMALQRNTTAQHNVAVGNFAAQFTTTGGSNVAIGFKSLQNNTTGVVNTAIGTESLNSNTTGYSNTACGFQSMTANTTGYQNTALGQRALNGHYSGKENVALGYNSLFSDSTGVGNVGAGVSTLYSNKTGKNNVALGYNALYNVLGDGNIGIGNSAGYNETGSNKLYIDNTSTTTPLIYGDFSTDDVLINGDLSYTGSLTSVSDRRLKTDISQLESVIPQLSQMHGYRYQFTNNAQVAFVLPEGPQIGLLAQEVGRVYPEMVKVLPSGYQSVDYIKLVPVLLEAIHELDARLKYLESAQGGSKK